MWYALWFVSWTLAGAVLGQVWRGRPLAGFYLGLLLGPVGLIGVGFVRDMRVRAPQVGAFRGLAVGEQRDGFCVRCGVEAYSQAELGRVVYRCPKCGATL